MPLLVCSVASMLAYLVMSAAAIRAVPGQQCAAACADVTRTRSSDIVCTNDDFDNTVAGRAFQNCLSCQQTSTANDPNTGESDLRWFIYNLRFAMSTCLWGYGNTTITLSTPCVTAPACGLYESSMEFNALLPNASTFDYCTNFDGLTQQGQEPRCLKCLQQITDDYYISNFFTALVAGCQQRPNPGSTLAVSGSLFSKTALNITTPVPTAIPVYSAQPSGGLGLGGIVGVAIGALVFVIAMLGCLTVCCGKRRRRAQLQRAHAREMYISDSRMSVAPVEPRWNQNTADGWSPEEMAVDVWGSEDKTFSPYESRYNSPVSARDMLNPKQIWEAHEPGVSAVKAAPKTKEEVIEMEKVPRKSRERGVKGEQQVLADFVQDAANKGFTTAPIIRMPETTKGKSRAGP